MNKIEFNFDTKKATESILYLAKRVSDSDIYGICKLLYLVDKTSLEKYGRFIFGETYVAMQGGPAPSNTYDLLKKASVPIDGIHVKGNAVMALREADLSYLSESDIECLDKIIEIYGKAPNWQRRNDTHDDAYKKTWDTRGNKKAKKISIIDIANQFDDSDDLIDYLKNRNLN
jgi:uncharacterized phage-associated protein